AQGGDGRSYPWGDDPALGNCYSAYNHDTGRAQVARTVGSFPADCSVQGVYDLAGSVAEFVDGSWIDHPTFALYCGGSYGDRDPQRFTTTAEGVVDVRQVHPRIGIRLICAVPEP
ncbi:MAG: SUMF1/EgtB/PvdO family nonheme iron enzyme, partial [Planctomycetota bacterium]